MAGIFDPIDYDGDGKIDIFDELLEAEEILLISGELDSDKDDRFADDESEDDLF